VSRVRTARVAELIPAPVDAVRAELSRLPRRTSAAVAELPVGILLTLEEQRGWLDRRPRWYVLRRLQARLGEIDRRASRQVVVAAAIVRDHRVLLAQRDHPSESAGRWEFPGGKVERGETPRAALVREIAEELGTVVTVGDELARQELPDGAILQLFLAVLAPASPEPTAREHRAVEWANRVEIYEREWAGTNGEFVTEVTGRL